MEVSYAMCKPVARLEREVFQSGQHLLPRRRPRDVKQYIEEDHQITQMRFQMPLTTLKQLLERTNTSQKRKDCFDDPALIPCPLLTELEIGQDTIFATKPEITQGDGLRLVLRNQGQKTIVASVSGRPLPIYDTPVLIDDPAEFDTANPTPMAFAFAADLFVRTTIADRVKQFNAITVSDGEEGRFSEKAICPVSMSCQQALQARALWQARKQVRKLRFEPAIKVPKLAALEREQSPDGHDFNGEEFRRWMFGHVLHAVINRAKELCDNVFSLHWGLLGKWF
jgi:hypothetical protein